MDDLGFYSGSAPARVAVPLLPQCGKCRLHLGCKSPKMPVSGDGERKILIVAEAPGADEDEAGRQFVGVSGQLLEESLEAAGIDMRRDCWLHNALACRPTDNKIKDKRAIDYCRPLVQKAIKELKPRVILLLGESAIRSVIGAVWKEDSGFGPTKWAGWKIPCRKPNAWVCPTFHPSFVMRSERDRDAPLVRKVFNEHVRQAVACKGRPWKEVPDEASQVEVITSDAHAEAMIVDGFNCSPNEAAFDFETTCLKPDGPHAEIVCCSISDGATTIAYPWTDRTAAATKQFLTNPNVKKVGANIKFETRWVRRHLGVWVRGWVWDTMLAAHALDSRSGITGLKFQSFVRLGVPDYDSHVKDFLKAKVDGGNEPNRIRDADFRSVLQYCGVDSLVEYNLAKLQMGDFKCR